MQSWSRPHYNLNLLDLSIPLDDQYGAVQSRRRQRWRRDPHSVPGSHRTQMGLRSGPHLFLTKRPFYITIRCCVQGARCEMYLVRKQPVACPSIRYCDVGDVVWNALN